MKNRFWNLVATIRNGQSAKKFIVKQKKNKICEAFLNILWDEGFILGYKTSFSDSYVHVYLKYKNKVPAIKNLKSVSKPSLRVYYSVKQLWKIDSNQSLLVLSTNQGLLSLNSCKKLKVGGEPIVIVK
jgi:small subunit ribosomal protein S8